MSAESAETAIQLTIVLFAGWAMASYATTMVYRLPRNEPLFDRNPFCGTCEEYLQPRDLFPIFSWIVNRGKCRFCGENVPLVYLLVEFSVVAVFVLSYFAFGISEQFLLVSCAATGAVVLAAVYVNDHFFSGRIIVTMIFLGALYRTLQDGSIYPFLMGGFIATMLGASVWQIQKRLSGKDNLAFPAYVKLLAVIGVWFL